MVGRGAKVPDPYKALGLSHDATNDEIKRAYRKLAMQYHPDRLTRMNATPEQMQLASAQFAVISGAYALLSDEARKREYDHIYKFGGYDDVAEDGQQGTLRPFSADASRKRNSKQKDDPFGDSQARGAKKQMGIGYSVTDPIAFILSQGKIRNTTIAGVQIPSRFHLTPSSPDNGFRVAFSNGQIKESPSGTLQCVAKTTQFVGGKKFSRMETTTLHRDGRKEIIIEGDDYIERRFTTAPPRRKQPQNDEGKKDGLTSTSDEPWYMSAWNGLRDNLQMCYKPCGTISVQ